MNALHLSLVQATAGDLIQGLELTGPLPDPSLANDTNLFTFVSRTGTLPGGGLFPIFGASNFQGTVTSLTLVPEPSAAALLAGAAFALAVRSRR